jgi:hypothetical protein
VRHLPRRLLGGPAQKRMKTTSSVGTRYHIYFWILIYFLFSFFTCELSSYVQYLCNFAIFFT